MITHRKLAEYITAEPFRPSRIRMASGRIFEIPHPEMIMVGRGTVKVYSALENEGEETERWHDLSMMLLEVIEPIETPAKS